MFLVYQIKSDLNQIKQYLHLPSTVLKAEGNSVRLGKFAN